MITRPLLHIELTIHDVNDAGRGDEEEDLHSVLLYLVDGGCEADAGRRRKRPKGVLQKLLKEKGVAIPDDADEVVVGLR